MWSKQKRGGVCIYIEITLAYSSRADLYDSNLEAIWIELLLQKNRLILIGAIYRPQHQGDFLDNFDKSMDGLPPDQEIYVFGDLNICDNNKTRLRIIYRNTLDTHGMNQIITSNTRLSKTPPLIDHIICNNHEKIAKHGVLDIGFNDHQITFCTRKITKKQFYETYHSLLKSKDWSSVYSN